MFTGLVEYKGVVVANRKKQCEYVLTVSAPLESVSIGDSIAVNGVCLTLVKLFHQEFLFHVSSETVAKTNLAKLECGVQVNIERAMQAHSRFGGHYVSGHVDTTAYIKKKQLVEECMELTVSGFHKEHMKFLLPKGSITVNGVSLTINSVEEASVGIMLIPHTINKTNLSGLSIGSLVNIEFDYLTRIIAHQLKHSGYLKEEVIYDNSFCHD